MKGFFIKTRNISVNVTGLENICCVFLGVCVCVCVCVCISVCVCTCARNFQPGNFTLSLGHSQEKQVFCFGFILQDHLLSFWTAPSTSSTVVVDS